MHMRLAMLVAVLLARQLGVKNPRPFRHKKTGLFWAIFDLLFSLVFISVSRPLLLASYKFLFLDASSPLFFTSLPPILHPQVAK